MANEVCFRILHLDKPWTLATYRSAGGYEVWEKSLGEKITPDEIIAQMKASVLRGRGGEVLSAFDDLDEKPHESLSVLLRATAGMASSELPLNSTAG